MSEYPRTHSDIQCDECQEYFTLDVDLIAHRETEHTEKPTMMGATMSANVHDASCEAGWGSGGHESPCRCAERAQSEPSDAEKRLRNIVEYTRAVGIVRRQTILDLAGVTEQGENR